MKRYIKSSKFPKIDQVTFARQLASELAKLIPKRAYVRINLQYNVINIQNVNMTERQFKKRLGDAIENAGYSVFSFPEGDHIAFAAVDNNDSWASVDFLHIDYENMFEVYIDCNHGNAFFEDWYVDTDN